MTDRELMQMALDALESSRVFVTSREKIKHPEGTEWYDERIEALRAALAQPEQEPIKHWSDCAVHNAPAYPSGKCDCGGFPVAWFDPKGVHLEFDIEDCFSFQEKEGYKPLYTAPPQREWVGLTDDEITRLRHLYDPTAHWSLVAFTRAIEAKLKEKNS